MIQFERCLFWCHLRLHQITLAASSFFLLSVWEIELNNLYHNYFPRLTLSLSCTSMAKGGPLSNSCSSEFSKIPVNTTFVSLK